MRVFFASNTSITLLQSIRGIQALSMEIIAYGESLSSIVVNRWNVLNVHFPSEGFADLKGR